ncbi:hypothetical protein V8C42DRAFT_322465 [Trichoderma barbatum]
MSEVPDVQEPQQPTLKRKGFHFCQGVLTVGYINRIDGRHLRELFKPSTVKDMRDEKKIKEKARKLFTKSFFAAQLRHYDISFQSSSSSGELRLLLKDAVSEGKCDHVPKSVMELEASMRAEYEPLRRKWEGDYAAWNAEDRRRSDEASESFKTPEGTIDYTRYVDPYDLTDGRLDKPKPTAALAQRRFREGSQSHGIAEKAFSMDVASDSLSLDREFCIGFYNEEDLELVESESDRQKAKWEQELERHQKYVAKMQSKGASKGVNKRPKAFNLDRCQGSYIIQCDETADNWPELIQGRTATLDISSGKGQTLRAAYDFGLIKGTMILSLSEDTLQAVVGEASTTPKASFRNEDNEAEDDEGDFDLHDFSSGKKRKLGKASLAQTTGSAALQHANAKRRKTTPLPSRRVYFWFRGRETGEGEIFYEPEPGHIDFMSDDCATFTGLMYSCTYVGNNVKFQGYKVSDKPQAKPEKWKAFSEEAHERERVGRWN